MCGWIVLSITETVQPAESAADDAFLPPPAPPPGLPSAKRRRFCTSARATANGRKLSRTQHEVFAIDTAQLGWSKQLDVIDLLPPFLPVIPSRASDSRTRQVKSVNASS